jgi:hypothetical protein
MFYYYIIICTLLRLLLSLLRDVGTNGWACPGRADWFGCGAVLAGDPRLLLIALVMSTFSDPGLCYKTKPQS